MMTRHTRLALALGLALPLAGCVTTTPPPASETAAEAAAPPRQEEPPPAQATAPVDPAAFSALSKRPLPKEGAPVDPSAYSALSKRPSPKEGAPVDPSAYSALSKRSAPKADSAPREAWSYSGENGPAQWAELGREFSACAGPQQSPVDMATPEVQPQEPVRFRYKVAKILEPRLQNLPRLPLANGGGIQLGGEFYALSELHIHVPAEHGVTGQPMAAMEVQLIHRSEKGRLAAVAVLMDERGEENVTLHRILNAIPGAAALPLPGVAMFNPANLLPGSARYVTYTGSLTTPPCSEGVTWVVMQERGEVSSEQLSRVRGRFPNSARPWQPLHGRKILSD